MITKRDLFADLQSRIEEHVAAVTATSTCSGQAVFQPLSDDQLNWQPDPKEWSILQCFDHLNLTHEYYRPKIEAALQQLVPAKPDKDEYKPSFWGRIYMYFALNPRYSFPTAEEITPETAVSTSSGQAVARQVLEAYLTKQTELLQTLDQCADVDLRYTRIPISTGVKFNLGDVLKILVYHDELHFGQARGILEDMDIIGANHV